MTKVLAFHHMKTGAEFTTLKLIIKLAWRICQRPLYFERIWQGYIAYRRQWKNLVREQVAFQLAVAKFDTERKSEQTQQVESDEEDCDVQIPHEPNQALLAVQLQERQDVEISFSDHHTQLFRKVCVQLRTWILDVDSEAISMRPVTLLELYVVFRTSFVGKYPLLADERRPGLFETYTFAVDFSFFKKVWRHLAKWANFEWTSCQFSLRHLNILNPQPAVWIGWDFTQEASNLLKDFVGNRPIQSAQALAKPWNPWFSCQGVAVPFFISFLNLFPELGLLGLRPQLALRHH